MVLNRSTLISLVPDMRILEEERVRNHLSQRPVLHGEGNQERCLESLSSLTVELGQEPGFKNTSSGIRSLPKCPAT